MSICNYGKYDCIVCGSSVDREPQPGHHYEHQHPTSHPAAEADSSLMWLRHDGISLPQMKGWSMAAAAGRTAHPIFLHTLLVSSDVIVMLTPYCHFTCNSPLHLSFTALQAICRHRQVFTDLPFGYYKTHFDISCNVIIPLAFIIY